MAAAISGSSTLKGLNQITGIISEIGGDVMRRAK
jgi:hypothetical protein